MPSVVFPSGADAFNVRSPKVESSAYQDGNRRTCNDPDRCESGG